MTQSAIKKQREPQVTNGVAYKRDHSERDLFAHEDDTTESQTESGHKEIICKFSTKCDGVTDNADPFTGWVRKKQI